ncbi:MAG: DUF1648 domain-containing protein [Bacteroidota bacterium]
MSWSRLLLWTLALGLIAWAVMLWPAVPEKIPAHFDASGEPDRWADRSLGAWLTLPLVGLGLAGVMEGTSALIRRPGAPGLNLPNKDAILALPGESRQRVLAVAAAWIRWVGVVSLVGFGFIQVGTWVEAQGAGGQGWVLGGGLMLLIGSLAALPWGLVAIDAELKRQQALVAASGD